MNLIILDFTDHKYAGEVYKTIKKQFNLPPEYGENLDALWDSLDGYCKDDLHICIKGIYSLSDEMFSYMGKILGVFNDIHDANPNMTFEIVS